DDPHGATSMQIATVPASDDLPFAGLLLRPSDNLEDVAGPDRRPVEDLFLVARKTPHQPQPTRRHPDDQPGCRTGNALAQATTRQAAEKRRVHVRSDGSRGPSGASSPCASRTSTPPRPSARRRRL